jgi:hypothetical protein
LASLLLTGTWLIPVHAAVDVSARLSAGSIDVGSVVTLLVIVSEPNGSVADPQFVLPAGLEQLGGSRDQQMAWVNGRSSNQVTFRFEIGATLTGRYTVGPIRVGVGNQVYRSGELPLTVTQNTTGSSSVRPGRGSANTTASLVMTLDPPSPVVGQVCRLRVQLVQRVDMSEDSDYNPPATPGFWSESWGDATQHEAQEGRNRVTIIERSLRLYPLSPGPAVIPPAHGMVTPQSSGLLDLYGGLVSPHVELFSDSVHVAVRPLPPGAPAGFDTGVGQFELAWSADRSHTTQDQAITASLDVRGIGNLPLLRAPAYVPADFDVFAATVEDSLPTPGSIGSGRRTFLWTLLPRRAGMLRVPAPTLVWFDPAASRYQTATPGALSLEVMSPSGAAGAGDTDGLPSVFRGHRARPGGRAAWPPLALAGGLLVAAAVLLWRRSWAPDPGAPERARQREWLRSIGLAHGPDFWRAADEASSWLTDRGEPVLQIREAIAAARYGGRTDQEADIRRRLIERLGAAMPGAPARWPLQTAAVLAAACGLALAIWSAPRGGSDVLAERAARADTRARNGHVEEAEAEWARLWDESPGDPALAARLAWGALVRDDIGGATVWLLRGERGEARDPAVRILSTRVRDAGGLVGAPGRALPFRSTEWGLLAFALALSAGLLWTRRMLGVVLLLLAGLAGAWWPGEAAWRAQQRLAVVRGPVPLPPGGVLLDAGQVVRVRKRSPKEVAVRVTSDLEGTLPPTALWFMERR